MIEMGDGKRDGKSIIGRVENAYELATNSKNLRVHLKGDTLQDHTAYDIFKEIVQDRHYNGKQNEFLTLTKVELKGDFVVLTLLKEQEMRYWRAG